MAGAPERDTTVASEPVYDSGVPMLLLTVPEAARALSIGRTTLYELIADHAIEVVHIRRSIRIPVDALRRFVEERRSRC